MHENRYGAVCLAYFCLFTAALNAEAIVRVLRDYSIIQKHSILINNGSHASNKYEFGIWNA